jgi:DNA processing protein
MMKQYYIWLQELKGLPLRLKKELLECFSSPKSLYLASSDELPEFVQKYPDWLDVFQSKNLRKSEEILRRHESLGIKTLTIDDPDYLPKKKQIPGSPLVLYYKGNLPDQKYTMVAIVGSRKATAYGKSAAEFAAKNWIQKGAIILSGLAVGIDTVAHQTALSLNGTTVAFIANGLDTCYPFENKNLMEAILEKGAVISPNPAGTAPAKFRFYSRNEIMGTWADHVIVVEGTAKSGAVMTGELALKNKRPVYAVPNNIFLSSSFGSNKLLLKGALPYLGAEAPKAEQSHKDKTSADPIISMLMNKPMSAESLAALLSKTLEETQLELFILEYEDKIKFHPDGKWHFTGW